ncbi:serine-rich adhesin for platelets isoform X1 [Neodiprion pinetum]|uniref:serine-rich adhesin for platelets isoform X1 n=1 Tax=Neodiprion pinetum TaxID=441929 RepID=UPI001EDFCF35|nr:mucin-3A-like [Neodiprion pinetum]
MPRKENTKARTWERDRRERMNTYFKTLGDLLPPHQDGRKRNKVDILTHAAKYIKELHGRMEELFHAHASDVHKEELVRLKKLVTQLFSRTQLLSTLLKEAGISIPAEPAIEKVSALKWVNRIGAENIEKLFPRVEEKKRSKKKKEKIARNKVPSTRKSIVSSQSKSKIASNDNAASKNTDHKIEDQENRLNTSNKDSKRADDEVDSDAPDGGPKTNVPATTSSSQSTEANNTPPKRRNNDSGAKKVGSHKTVKRKTKTNQQNKIINQPVANITSGTLILSRGKIMPVVTPITPLPSNIIVNGQSQSTNPIILSNAQPNQMIVMQHLPNPAHNSVIPVCNQTLINAVQKVTLNPVPSIQTNIIVSSQDWVSNVKSIIHATKISGRKSILPKGKEITKTTMTYKVPIPAVHKEKSDRSKDVVNRKDAEAKTKIKNAAKGAKNQQSSSKSVNVEETSKANTKNHNSTNTNKELSGSIPLKRILNTKSTNQDEPDSKKLKSVDGSDDMSQDENNMQAKNSQVNNSVSTCESIESLQHVVQKIGTEMTDGLAKDDTATFQIHTNKSNLNTNSESPNNSSKHEYLPLSSTNENSSTLETAEPSVLSACSNSGSLTALKEADGAIIKSTDSLNAASLGEAQISTRNCPMPSLNDVIAATRFSEGMTVSTDSSATRNEKLEVSPTNVGASGSAVAISSAGCEGSERKGAEKEETVSENVKSVCNLGTRFDSLLQANVKRPDMVESIPTLEASKIILNLDTNTTTTLKPEANLIPKSINAALLNEDDNLQANKIGSFAKDEGLKSLSYSADNSFIPISRTEALHSDLSNDIFASLQVPSSSHHPESISPTAAFLMAFPLVSSLNGKTEVLEEEMKEDFKDRSQTPPMLLQIGAMEPNSFKLKTSAAIASKEGATNAQHEVIEGEKKIVSSHVVSQQATSSMQKSMTENNKEVGNSSKITNEQPEVKESQNLGGNLETHDKRTPQSMEAELTKSMPKIIRTENVKEQYKIVQTSIPLSLTTPVEMNNTFAYTSPTSTTVSYSAASAITTCAPAQIQSSPVVHHNRSVTKNTQNIIVPVVASASSVSDSSTNLAEGINSRFQMPAESHTSIPVSRSKYDLRPQYTATQNFIPNYTNLSRNMELPQYTPPTFTSSVHKTPQNSLGNVCGITNVSQTLTQCHVMPKNHTSSQNLHINYPVHNKESHVATSTDQTQNLSDSLRSKQQNQDHRHETYHTKKVETENFGQNFSFTKDNNVVNPQNQTVQGNSNAVMFQDKHSTTQTYMPYSKDSKKITGSMVPTVSSGKLILENTVHYPQNSMVVASNYEQSTVTDNNMKSTTTVAHNSSNFSILSWTTFSPAGGNNNTMHYEQGQVPADTTENKTICENFGYVPLHKENVGFTNMLPEFSNDAGLNVNKLGNKPMVQAQKQPFIDQPKSQNIQTTLALQKQNQNPSADYKFSNENKTKAKYTIENNSMQSIYANMEQQAKHQTIPNKQEKSNYPMPSYNPQVLFNVPDTMPQVKYSTENYTGANFKYTEKPQQNQKYQPAGQSHAVPAPLEQTNSVYKQSQNGNKSKAQQIRPPVNWMMTPEIKHNTNISDIILPPIGKELEYCQNNLFAQNTSYNQGATNQFYNNYDVTHSFPNIPVLQNEPRKVDTFYSEDQPFSWSPNKNTHVPEQTQTVKPIDQHIVPSTLPTLVGDLALGTNIPEKQNFLFGQMPARLPTEHNKDLLKEKESNATREFHTILNPQNGQQVPQGTFLSVSQLVEHEKAEKSQQARKHQRKSTSPRGNGKRQLDIRKQGPSDQLHHEDAKSSVQTFSEQNYQQKYHQNDAHWRNRNCKSNYTAEALIGTNTNVPDDNQQDKHASIKFTPNYAQNKFSGALPTDTMMPINYFSNADDGSNYGQTNQNFNSYAYSSNANIYPTTNFITSISNTPSSYMMPLHENSDYLEPNSFLLPNASASNTLKSQHYISKHQNCDKRSYSTPKRSKRKPEIAQNIEFPMPGINSPLEDYHPSFLSHANLYQNPTQANIYPKAVNTNLPGLPMPGNQNAIGSGELPMNSNTARGTTSNSPMVMAHPSGTSLTNFNLSTIFPEINDKVQVAGYKPPNSMLPGLTQPTGHTSNYTQRSNYSNSLGHVPQVSESAQFPNNMTPSSSVHYKN